MPKNPSKKKEEYEEEDEMKKKDSKKRGKKPKGASSAYNIYVAEHRAQINAENPGLSFGELSKRVSADWKLLTDEQRKPYEERAAEDKKRYERERAEFPDDGEDEGPSKKRKKKDPDAPKKNLNAWMFFIQEVRPQIVEQLGEEGRRVAQVTKAVGERWSKMTAEEKQPYEDMAIADKKRYQQEMEQYNQTH